MKIKGLRWWIVSLVALATVINYIDRSALPIMWPDIARDLGMDPEGVAAKTQYGTIMNMFMIAYAISQSLSGKLYDWIGTRLGFLVSILIWSISAAFHGIARGVMSFSFFRFTLGLGEAGNWPGATKSNAEWFPIRQRAFAQGIFNSGASLGSILSPPLIALLYLAIGWKLTFVILGVLGMLWIIPWLILNKTTPESHPWITAEEKELILKGQNTEGAAPSEDEWAPGWMEMMGYRQSWSVIASRFFLDPIWWLFVGWLPLYLAERFGFNIKEIGMFAWMPYVGAMAGSLFGGWLSGQLINNGWSVNGARKAVIILGGVIMVPALLATSIAATPLFAVLLIAAILFGFQVAMNNIQTLPSDFYSGKAVGSLAGVGGTSAAIGVIIMNWLVPNATVGGNYAPAFVMGALLVVLAGASVFLFGGTIQRVQVKR